MHFYKQNLTISEWNPRVFCEPLSRRARKFRYIRSGAQRPPTRFRTRHRRAEPRESNPKRAQSARRIQTLRQVRQSKPPSIPFSALS